MADLVEHYRTVITSETVTCTNLKTSLYNKLQVDVAMPVWFHLKCEVNTPILLLTFPSRESIRNTQGTNQHHILEEQREETEKDPNVYVTAT